MRVALAGLFSLSFFLFLFSEESFTTKRSKKGPSRNSLKESCCEQFGSFLSESSHLLSSLGVLQNNSMRTIEGYFKSDKSSWCELASREQLHECKEKISKVNEKVEELREACDEVVRILGPKKGN